MLLYFNKEIILSLLVIWFTVIFQYKVYTQFTHCNQIQLYVIPAK